VVRGVCHETSLRAGPGKILDRSAEHDDGEQQAEGVGDHEPTCGSSGSITAHCSSRCPTGTCAVDAPPGHC
jgi:hypothetical protein